MDNTETNISKPSFLSYRGRARRRTWWCATLVVGTIAAIATVVVASPVVCAIADGGMDDLNAVLSKHGGSLLFAFTICMVATFLLLPVNVRRLHDRNMSGWWMLAFIVGGMIPYVGPVVGFVQFIVLGCLDGTPETNRFGPPNK